MAWWVLARLLALTVPVLSMAIPTKTIQVPVSKGMPLARVLALALAMPRSTKMFQARAQAPGLQVPKAMPPVQRAQGQAMLAPRALG